MAKDNRVKSTNDLELKDRLVAINRVTKVTKGGRTFSFSAIVVVGNEDGVVGWGLGKASEVTAAISKGVEAAKKNLIKVPVRKGTIPHDQVAKFGRSPGVYQARFSRYRSKSRWCYACRTRKCGYNRRVGKIERFVQPPQPRKSYHGSFG